MSEEQQGLRNELDNGKYTYIYQNGVQKALRYGEQWRDLTGDNFVFHMAHEIDELQAKVVELEAKNRELRDAIQSAVFDHANLGEVTRESWNKLDLIDSEKD